MEDLKEAVRTIQEKKNIGKADTVPDDIPLTFSCDGLITAGEELHPMPQLLPELGEGMCCKLQRIAGKRS